MRASIIRIIWGLLIVMMPLLVVAQGRDSWSCASINPTGYSWNGSTWEQQGFANRSWRFTFAGNASRQTINGQRIDFSCNTDQIIKQCRDHGIYFIFNTDTGRGALADLFGVVINPDDNRQAFVELVECARDSGQALPQTFRDSLAPTTTALEKRLRELEELKNNGVISEQEYIKARSAALGL